MAEYGIVKGSEVKINLEGEKKSRVLQVQITDDQDIQSVELYRMPGEDYNPSNETRVVVITIGTSKVAIAAADVEAVDDLAKGEREYYSDDGENRLATIRLNAASEVVLNAGEETAVRFAALQTAFDDLQDTVNDFLNQYVPGGPAAVGTPAKGVVLPSTADIAKAESETVKVP